MKHDLLIFTVLIAIIGTVGVLMGFPILAIIWLLSAVWMIGVSTGIIIELSSVNVGTFIGNFIFAYFYLAYSMEWFYILFPMVGLLTHMAYLAHSIFFFSILSFALDIRKNEWIKLWHGD